MAFVRTLLACAALVAAGVSAAAFETPLSGVTAVQRGATFGLNASAAPGCRGLRILQDNGVRFTLDCRQSASGGTATFSAFGDYRLMAPWRFHRTDYLISPAGAGDDLRVLRAPQLGDSDLRTVISLRAGAGRIISAQLRPVAFTQQMIAPPFPQCGRPPLYLCSSNADCGSGFVCAPACGACAPPSALIETVVPPQPRTLTFDELGPFHNILWERSLPRRCGEAVNPGGQSGGVAILSMNCNDNPLGTSASFDFFRGKRLRNGWVVASVVASDFGATSAQSSSAVLTRPQSGDPALFTRIRQRVRGLDWLRTTVTIFVRPTAASFPDPLPFCVNPQPNAIAGSCTTDAECRRFDPAATCKAECAFRCALPR